MKKNLGIHEIFNQIKIMINESQNSNYNGFHRYLNVNNNFYNIYFAINGEVHKSDVKTYFTYKVENFIKRAILAPRSKSFTFAVPHKKNSVYSVTLKIERIKKEEIFIIDAINHEVHAKVLSSKIYNIIADASKTGIAKSKFYNKTRFLSKTMRENIILQLISENKIIEKESGSAKKKTIKYFAK